MVGGITFGGVVSGLDTNAIIDALLTIRSQPITGLERQAELVYLEKQSYQRVNSYILALQKATLTLRYESTYKRKSVTSSNEAILSATAGMDALNRSYSITIDQVARGAQAISGLNDRGLNRSGALMMNGNTAGISALTADSTSLGAVRATYSTLLKDTLQAGEGSAVVTAGDTISITGILKNGVTNVSGTFTFAADSTDTLQRLAQTIQSTFQGEVSVAIGRNGELVLTETNPSVAGNITLSSLTFNDVDYSGSTFSIGAGNSYAGGTALANVLTGTKTFTTGATSTIATAATLIQDLDQVTGTLDSGLDQINVSGTDFDGTSISGSYTFTAGDTLGTFVSYLNGLYTGATASIQNGRLVLTDTATGTSQTSLDISFDDDATTTNTFDLGLLITAIQGTSSTAQTVHTSEFNVAAKGKHIVTVTNGLGGQLTGAVSLDADTLLASLGVTDPHLFTIDVDSGAAGVEPVQVRGLNIWSTVQDFVEAVNTQVPGVTARLVSDGGSQHYVQITSNTGGKDIRLADDGAGGILENLFNPTGGTDTDYTTANATTVTTDFTMVSRFTPNNGSGEQRYIYTGAEGTGVSDLIENFTINGGAANVFNAGVAIVYTVEDSELDLRPATDSHIIGASGVSDPANTTHPPLNVYIALSQAGFATTPENAEDNEFYHTDGTFTINGVQITIGDVDAVSVNDIIGLINSSGAGVIAEYDATADRFILRRGDPGNTSAISLGGAGDTSNFLTIAGLAGTVGSASFTGAAKGSINLDTTLAFAQFTLPPSAGTFTINGVKLYVDPSSETLRDLITKINNSAAGVEASYDATQDRLLLSQKLTANPTFDQISVGALSDTSNILSSFRLTNSTISTSVIGTTRQDARFTVDGQEYTRATNSIDDVINDVTFELRGVTSDSPISLSVTQNTEAGLDAVTDFIVSYNSLIELINPRQLTTDEKDAMEPLSDEAQAGMTATEIDAYNAERESLIQRDTILHSSVLRRLNTLVQQSVFDPVKGVASGRIDRLSLLGINTGSVGLDASSAVDVPYLVSDTTDPEEIRSTLETETSLTTYLLDNADEMFDLFAKDIESSVSLTGTMNINAGVSLGSTLRFRIGDGTTYATVEMPPAYYSKTDILNEINGALNVAGLSASMQVSITAQGYLLIESTVDDGRARIAIIDDNGGAQLDDYLGLESGSTYGDYARLSGGLARRLDYDLDNFTGINGFINERIRFGGILDRQLLQIGQRISDFEDRLYDYEVRLRRQYSYVEQMLSRYQSVSSYIAQQVTAWGGSTSTTSSTTSY